MDYHKVNEKMIIYQYNVMEQIHIDNYTYTRFM